MNISNFSDISKNYIKISLVQKAAGETLFDLLQIKDFEDVLDLGCGPGHLTFKIAAMTKGKVVGIDPSCGMIQKANLNHQRRNIVFEIDSAENLHYENEFDVIFCNSAFQWFQDPERALRNCFVSLRKNGRIGIQAPGGKIYSPNFREAIHKVKNHPDTANMFSYFRPPWIFLKNASEYSTFFKNAGFDVVFSKIKRIETQYSPAEVFEIFKSGASAGYLNQDYYDIPINPEYQEKFLELVEKSFIEQSKNNIVNLIFNRIFILAKK